MRQFHLLATLVLLAAALARPQGLQQGIVGEIKDSSGAVLPNVTVTVTNTATNVATAVRTDGSGRYSVPGLVVGEYSVKAAAAGMKTAIQNGVAVQADKTVRVDLTMAVGELMQTVVIDDTGVLPLLRTEDAATGVVVSNQQVNSLPLKGRDFVSLAQMAPGANEAQPGNQNSLGRTQPMNLSANGQRQFDNNYRLDGVSMIAGFVNGSTFIPSLEALQEVSVQTGQYSASMGLYSGAQVDMVVKSGTNQLHGSAYEFLRNNAFNARQFFDPAAPPAFRFNQFGITAGGPVLIPKIYSGRNRTFFFFAFEGDRTRRLSTGQGTAATAAMRAGDFSALLPKTIIKDPYTKLPFPGNRIPPNRIAPQAQKLMQYIPPPNLPGLSLNYLNTGSAVSDENQYFGRVDHKIGVRDTLFFRIGLRDAYFRNVTINPNFGSLGYPTNQNYVLSETRVFSPRIVNEARLSYVRESVPTQTGREGADIDPQRDFGMTGLNFTDPLIRGIPNAGITGYMGTGENFANPRLLFSNPGFSDNVFIQLNRHSLRAGGDFNRWRQDFFAVNDRHQGSFSFTGILSGDAFADFLLGLPSSTTKSDFLDRTSLRQKHASAYLQDDWHVSSTLTLNLGVRYEYAGSYRDRMGNARNLDWRTLQLFPAPGETGPLNDSSHDFAPRFGFAWRLPRSNTVLRGGFGLFYTQPTVANVALMFRNPPRNASNTYNSSLDAPDLTLADGFLTQRRSTAAPPPPDLVTIPTDYGPGYAETWSFNIQQKLGSWVAEIGYTGSHTLHLDSAHTENTPPPGPGAVQPRRPIQQWGNIRVFGTDGVAYYNGLHTRIQTSSWHGLNFLASYTYSKCIDTRSSAATSSVGADDAEPQNQFDRIRGERGRCAIDFRQQFKTHGVYELPFGRNSTGALRAIAQGWQLSGGVTLHSGPAFTVIAAGNRANIGRGTSRPNRIADGNLPAEERTPLRWFDTGAFVLNSLYTFGNSGRGILEGPAAKLVDISLSKRFKFSEARSLELRGEAFNALNTPQFGLPSRNIDARDFGRISSTYPAREIQIGARFAF